MLMSLDTSTTSRGLRRCASARAAPAPRRGSGCRPCPEAGLSGSLMSSKVVWKNSLPSASLCPVLDSGMPAFESMLPLASVNVASASRLRLTWRALRATSLRPFLLLSSSSSVIIGRKMSCSSKRNSDIGSCISTLVSSTNSLAGPVPRGLRVRVRSAGAGAAVPALTGAVAAGAGGMTAATGRLSNRSSDPPAPRSVRAAGFRWRLSGRGAACDSKSAAARRAAFWAGGLGSGIGGRRRISRSRGSSKTPALGRRRAGRCYSAAPQAAFFSSLTALSTSSTWPATLMPRHS